MAEVLVAGAAAVLVAGVLLGTGFAQTVLAATDGLTWLGDDTRGEAILINPTTGRPEVRLTVAPPGHPLHIAQTDTLLVVTDTTTGAVTIIDSATLATTGTWHSTRNRTKVLLTATELYGVDRAAGTITRLDPATGFPIGRLWTTGTSLADAAIDSTGTIWALTIRGVLYQLRWADAALVDVAVSRRIGGTGPRTVLVPHERGSTIFAPESGQITQTGTGTGDITVAAPALKAAGTDGDLAAAEQAPDTLVPLAISSTDTLVLLTDRAAAITIDTRRYDCRSPGQPAVYRDKVYVGCDNGDVLVLDHRGGYVKNIPTGAARRPSLVLDEALLFINTPGGPVMGYFIDKQETINPLEPFAEDLAPQDPADPSPPPVIEPNRPIDPITDDPVDDDTTDTNPIAPRPAAATGVTATANTSGSVVVTWRHTGPVDRFEVLRTDTSTAVTQAIGPGARTATVTVVPPNVTTSYVVRAHLGTEYADSQPSRPTTTMGPPLAPPNVWWNFDDVQSLLTIRWSPSTAQGTPVTGYQISGAASLPAASFQRSAGAGATSVAIPLTACAGGGCEPELRIDIEVAADSASGLGPRTGVRFVYTSTTPPPPAPTVPGAPSSVSVSRVGLGDNPRDISVAVAWGAAADNGSPVTGYNVTLTSSKSGFPIATWTGTVSGLGTSVTLGCWDYCPDIRVDATVTAVNGVGAGPSGAGSYTYVPDYVVPRSSENYIDGTSTRPPDHSEEGMQAVLAAGLYCTFDPPDVTSVASCGPPDCIVYRVITRARCVQ